MNRSYHRCSKFSRRLTLIEYADCHIDLGPEKKLPTKSRHAHGIDQRLTIQNHVSAPPHGYIVCLGGGAHRKMLKINLNTKCC